MLGGWKRLSFEMNDLFINSSRQMSETKISEKTNDEYDLYPLEVYSQVVNGTNYNLLFAGRHFKDKTKIKLFKTTVYKPLGDKPQLSLDNDPVMVEPSDNKFNDNTVETKVSNVVSSYFGINGVFKVDKFFSEVYGSGCNVYTMNTEKGTAVVFESNGEFKVDAVMN